MKQILIIGGGAAGIAAALGAAEENPAAQITILEGLDRVGKKILATGNGHCNLSNESIRPGCYHTARPDRLEALLADMPAEMSVGFFRKNGLYCTADGAGRIYPYCRQASMVLDVLLLALKRKHIRIVCNCKVAELRFQKGAFHARSVQNESYCGDAVVLTTGGKAAPKQGTDGSGYPLAAAFGHKRTALYPCLVPLQCKHPALKGLKGIRVQCAVRLLADGEPVAEDRGELQLTDYGISGIPAMQLSCYLGQVQGAQKKEVCVDFFPDWDWEELRQLLAQRIEENPAETLETVFLGLLHKRVFYTLLKSAGAEPLRRAAETLSDRELDCLTDLLKGWTLPVTGTLSWEQAQTTGGGIGLEQIDDSFCSVYQRGLYFAGEILDAAGECGGYNLHWAWCSGMAAGRAAAR